MILKQPLLWPEQRRAKPIIIFFPGSGFGGLNISPLITLLRLLGDLYLQSLRGVYPKDIGTFLKNKEAVIATLEKEGLTSIMDCVLKMPEILETQQA